MSAPTISATLDKPSYVKGKTVVLTLTVQDEPRTVTTERTATLSGHDDEGNLVTAVVTTSVATQVPDNFTLDSVVWDDTGVAWQVDGLQATSVA